MDERERTNRSRKILSLVIRISLVCFAVYVGVQLLAVLNRGYKTETAIQYSMSDSMEVNGFLDLGQIAVEGDGLMGYLVESGERVSAGTAIAEKYEDISQAQCRERLAVVEAQIDLLERSQSHASDVDLLLNQMQSSLVNVLEDLDRMDYSALQEDGNEYLLSANKFQYTTGKVQDFSEPLEELKAERAELWERLGSPEPVYAVVGGYFVDAAHAWALKYDSEKLAEASPLQLQKYWENGAAVLMEEAAGKIVTSYQWDFYAVCTLEEGQKFEEAGEVELSFPGKANQPLPATVKEVVLDKDNGLAKVVLACDYMNSDIPSLAQETARVDFAGYEGIRIPAEALHIVEGEKGVYVKYGNIVKFRRIQVLYQDEDFILVPEDGKVGEENEVRLYDEIITEGSGLRDGKLL